MALLRWGLVPGWAKDRTIGNRLINARLETVAQKPAFRAAFRRRRCAVLADGFYEWQAVGDGPKQPWFIAAADGCPMLLAGLWERWERGEEPLETCTIITTQANAAMRPVHHRMPLILPRDRLGEWLAGSGETAAVDGLAGVVHPALAMRRIGRAVNNPANDGPRLIEAEA
jgi:putative SOS response-associated peptidase YedK